MRRLSQADIDWWAAGLIAFINHRSSDDDFSEPDPAEFAEWTAASYLPEQLNEINTRMQHSLIATGQASRGSDESIPNSLAVTTMNGEEEQSRSPTPTTMMIQQAATLREQVVADINHPTLFVPSLLHPDSDPEPDIGYDSGYEEEISARRRVAGFASFTR
jgi:hypothetical protein